MPRTFSDFEPLGVAKKWHVPAGDAERLKREAEDNELGYLGDFQEVRCGLARLAASKDWRDTEVRERILANSDLAIRCGGYLVFEFTAEEINDAWKRDRKIAARHLLSNDRVWRTSDLRDALREVCSLASKGDDYAVSLSAEYSRRDDQIRETNADWFREEDSLFIDDASDESADPVSEHLEGLGQRLAALQSEIRAIWWGLLILLVLGITRFF